MQVYVYKGVNKDDHYLYLDRELDLGSEEEISEIPLALVTMLGDLSLVLEFELTADRVLMQADATQVRADILEQGFYLQMPKKDMRAEEDLIFS